MFPLQSDDKRHWELPPYNLPILECVEETMMTKMMLALHQSKKKKKLTMNTVDSKPDSAPQESIQGRIAALQASSWWRQASSSSAVDYYELV